MKKLKLFGLIAMMLVVATVLCACGNFANLNKVYNEAYDADARQFTKAEVIADLEDYSKDTANDEVAVFKKAVDGKDTYKVYSFRNKAVVGTFVNSDTAKVAVAAVTDLPAYCVTTTTGTGEDEVVTYTYYGVDGNEIVKLDKETIVTGDVAKLNVNLAVIDTVAYTIDEATGLMTKKADIPAYVKYDVKSLKANDEFFYDLQNTIIIYDIDFKPVAVWNAPSYANGLQSFLLNNGSVLVQYSVELDEDAKKFDFYQNGNKYDLVSLVISTKGAVKEVNLDYIVKSVKTNYELYDENKATEDNEYTDKFENLATIAKIENQLIDDNALNNDFVLMNNSGKAQKSLKVVDGQKALPKRVSADMFTVDTVYGTAIIDAKGKVLFAATANLDVFGGYVIIAGRAIYDLNFEVVYDLKANFGTVIHKAGNVVFVKAGEKVDEKYEILAFVNGAKEAKTITTFDNTVTTNVTFATADVGYSLSSKDDAGKTTYTYYAPNGTELLKTTAPIASVAAAGNGDVAIYSVKEVGDDGKAVTKFYAFTK